MDSCTPVGGLDLSQCDRVHLPVGYTGGVMKRKNGKRKKSENIFVEGEWKGREGSAARATGKSSKNTNGKVVGEKRK